MFIPDVEKDIVKYFNAQDSKAAIADTYIPRENRKIVSQNEDTFAGFGK